MRTGGINGEQRGETLKKGRRKLYIIELREKEREKKRGSGLGDCTMWGLCRRAASRGDNSLYWRKSSPSVTDAEGEEKNAACHSLNLFFRSVAPFLSLSIFVSFFFSLYSLFLPQVYIHKAPSLSCSLHEFNFP